MAKKHASQKDAHKLALEERIRQRKEADKLKESQINAEKERAKIELESLQNEQNKLRTDTLLPDKKTQKVTLDLTNYDSGNPLALLTELPVLKTIQNFEQKLLHQMEQFSKQDKVLGSFDSPFIDIFDAQMNNSPSLVVLEKIPVEMEQIFEMASQIMDDLCVKMSVQVVKLLVAQNLPKTNYDYNAFRNSYFYDDRLNTVFIRKERFSDPGTLVLVIAHFVAHLSGNEFSNDNDIKFLTSFFTALQTILHFTFQSVSNN